MHSKVTKIVRCHRRRPAKNTSENRTFGLQM
jgi:hypothetical protein